MAPRAFEATGSGQLDTKEPPEELREMKALAPLGDLESSARGPQSIRLVRKHEPNGGRT